MILATIEHSLNTLGAPFLWTEKGDIQPFSIIQGISITCVKGCLGLFISRFTVVDKHIRITFSAISDKSLLCFLDADLVSEKYVYELESCSEQFVKGSVVIYGLPTMSDVDYQASGVYVNPLYIQWVNKTDAGVTPKLTLVSGQETIAEIDLTKLGMINTNTVSISVSDTAADANIREASKGVEPQDMDKITSINGQSIVAAGTDNSCTIDFGTGASVTKKSDSYAVLLGKPKNSCPSVAYLPNAIAPNGRAYKCPLDLLFGVDMNEPDSYNTIATAANYDISILDSNDTRFNPEYTVSAEDGKPGLLWFEFDPEHDPERDCNTEATNA